MTELLPYQVCEACELFLAKVNRIHAKDKRFASKYQRALEIFTERQNFVPINKNNKPRFFPKTQKDLE